MKTEQPIAKSVWAIVIVGLVVIVLTIWTDLRRRKAAPEQPAPVVKTSTHAVLPARMIASAPADAASTLAPGLPPVIPISLAGVLTRAENGSWLRDKDYLLVPHRPQTFGGVEFLMDGMIQMQGLASLITKNRSYRTNVIIPLTLTNYASEGREVIQRGRNIATVFLLGGTRYTDPTPVKSADLIWHYTDGTERRTPIICLEHIRDWVRNPYEEPAHLSYAFTKVVWTVPQPAHPGQALRLYRVGFANPAPDKIIDRLELASPMNDPTLFVIGVTLDPLSLGQRPDDTPDLEPGDAVPPKQIQIYVQDAGGQPLAQAKLQVQLQQRNGRSLTRNGYSLSTDANGCAPVNYPPQDLDTLQVSASHEDYGARKMLWDLSAGDFVPASYTLKLGAGIRIGGTVVDESDAPLAGAKISLYRFWSGDDFNPNRKGEQADFSSRSVTTDEHGAWQVGGLTVELLDHIGFAVEHADFIGTNLTVGANETVESHLRDGTFKIVLRRGLNVHGLVTDDDDNPISGASVWAGLRYFRERQQTKTGGDGTFVFHSISPGNVVFSVAAAGRQPDSKSFMVKPDMPVIVFKLPPGHVIRAVVQDESGSPVPGARVILEGNGDTGRTYEFSTTTGADGHFEWDGAPEDPQPFYIGKEGYEAKRNCRLTPDQDNTVTLHNQRQLQGRVLDATTDLPVTNFTVRAGQASPDNSDVYGVISAHDFSPADGSFALSLSEESDDAVAVYAGGYADQIQKFPEAQNGVVQLVVRLQPSAGLSGVVLGPDGAPAPGVNVAIASESPRTSIQLAGGHLRSYDSHTKMATTDANGQFTIASAPDAGTVVAAGDPGFAQVPLAQVRNNSTITLQAWGRVEGSLKIGGQPGVGKDLLFNVDIPGLGMDFNGCKTTTDDQGQFMFAKVPPGEDAIVRLISTSPNSWTWSDSTSVTVQPGETTQITLGDNGVLLAGTVRLETPSTNGENLNIVGNLSGQMPAAPAFNSSADARAFYQSPEWRALTKQVKHYAVEVNPDGTFTVENVLPGTYALNFSAWTGTARQWEHPPVAQGVTTITVPDSFSPTSPINIGEVVLQPVPPR